MKRARSTEGFTLFEMAITVLIMGSMAAMMAPGLSAWLADARASGAAEQLVRISRVVRARVNATGLAHLLVFRGTSDSYGSNGLGKVQVWEGMNNRCNQTPWVQPAGEKPEPGHDPIDGVDMADSAYNLSTAHAVPTASDIGRQVITITDSTKATMVALCFEPGGATFTGVDDTDAPDLLFRFTPQTEPIIFRVTRSVGGETRGMVREVIFPAGGNGRLRL